MNVKDMFQAYDNAEFDIENRVIFPLGCCDCGLVHDVVIAATELPQGAKLSMAMTRNQRKTAELRAK